MENHTKGFNLLFWGLLFYVFSFGIFNFSVNGEEISTTFIFVILGAVLIILALKKLTPDSHELKLAKILLITVCVFKVVLFVKALVIGEFDVNGLLETVDEELRFVEGKSIEGAYLDYAIEIVLEVIYGIIELFSLHAVLSCVKEYCHEYVAQKEGEIDIRIKRHTIACILRIVDEVMTILVSVITVVEYDMFLKGTLSTPNSFVALIPWLIGAVAIIIYCISMFKLLLVIASVGKSKPVENPNADAIDAEIK